MASAKPRYVDVQNPALAIDCPRCGLRTARFNRYCANCGYSLWPSSRVASAAFQAWRAQEPDRAPARRFDVALPVVATEPEYFDYEERAHQLGIHIFPSSNFPVVIAAGIMVLAFAAVPFGVPAFVRIAIGVVGALIFLFGVAGWVLVEDQRMYPTEALEIEHSGHGAGSDHELAAAEEEKS